MPKKKKPIVVDLFSGAGGMSLGFQQAGFEVVAAFDYNQRCVDAHARNFPRCISVKTDLSRTSGDELRELAQLGRKRIDVLIGGPPCGGFSIAGQRDPDDPRNRLLLRFATLVTQLRPSYFVVENVRGLVIGDAMTVLEKFRRKVEKAGYKILWPVRVLNAADFGVPQRRERIFVLGCKARLRLPSYPIPSTPKGSKKRVTVSAAIRDLEMIDRYSHRIEGDKYVGPLGRRSDFVARLRKRQPQRHSRSHSTLTGCLQIDHSPAAITRFRRTKPGTREPISRFYRLAYSGQSPTLRAGTDVGHGKFTAVRPIHPKHPRCITVREAARLHSFPDRFQFHQTKWHGFMQIGNSVPPQLARAVAGQVLAAATRSKANGKR